MSHIVLVHGAAANELSWFGVPDALRAAGHIVEPVRLFGHGKGIIAPIDKNTTMQDYIDTVENALPKTGQCSLIGHSMGGMVISQAAARFPGRIERLIYITAMLPKDGETA